MEWEVCGYKFRNSIIKWGRLLIPECGGPAYGECGNSVKDWLFISKTVYQIVMNEDLEILWFHCAGGM